MHPTTMETIYKKERERNLKRAAAESVFGKTRTRVLCDNNNDSNLRLIEKLWRVQRCQIWSRGERGVAFLFIIIFLNTSIYPIITAFTFVKLIVSSHQKRISNYGHCLSVYYVANDSWDRDRSKSNAAVCKQQRQQQVNAAAEEETKTTKKTSVGRRQSFWPYTAAQRCDLFRGGARNLLPTSQTASQPASYGYPKLSAGAVMFLAGRSPFPSSHHHNRQAICSRSN